MKKEIVKILLWFFATFLMFVLYKTFTSILYKNWDDLTYYFRILAEHPEQIILYFIPYLAYRIVFLVFYSINKFFSLTINSNKISFIIIISICSLIIIKIISEELILYSYYKNSFSGFVAEKNDSQIDSTNFKDFVWGRKTFQHDGLFFTSQKLWFKNDSTVVLSSKTFSTPDNMLTSDLFFRYLLNNYYDNSTSEYLFKDSVIFVGKITFGLKFENEKLETNWY